MIFKDYYKILELETNKVDLEDVKIAYREQAKKYHPDVNVGNKNVEEIFKDVNEAYKILSNPISKKKYDKNWNTYVGKKKKKIDSNYKEKATTSNEFLNMFFGTQEESKKRENSRTNQKVAIQGENIETEIVISIEEAFYGQNKKISLRTINGKLKTFNIKIPEGIRNGEKIRLIGQGKPGENGGKNGDLLINIKIINDKKYRLIGSDIYIDIPISPWEAILGSKVESNTIDEPINVYIPKGSQTGDRITIPKKGYKDGKGGRGNLIFEIKIMIQKKITEEEKELYKKLKKVSKFNPRKEYS